MKNKKNLIIAGTSILVLAVLYFAYRKKKMDEDQIIEKLHPMATTAFAKLHEKIKEGDMKAIQLFCAYYIGLPTQKIESKIEGNLNQIAIEIIKPNILLQDNRTVSIEESNNT